MFTSNISVVLHALVPSACTNTKELDEKRHSIPRYAVEASCLLSMNELSSPS